MEQKINDVDHVQRTNGLQIQNVIKRLDDLEESPQAQEPPKQPHQEKPDNKRKPDGLNQQLERLNTTPAETMLETSIIDEIDVDSRSDSPMSLMETFMVCESLKLLAKLMFGNF